MALAYLVLTGLAMAVSGLPQPHLTVQSSGHPSVDVPVVLLVATLTTFALAASFALTASFYSPWFLRIPVVAAFSLLALMLTFNDDYRPGDWVALAGEVFTGFAAPALLLFAIVLGPILRARQRRIFQAAIQSGPVASSIGRTYVTMLVIVLGVCMAPASSLATGSAGTGFAVGLNGVTAFFFLLLVPALLLAGTDFAEWADGVGEVVTRSALRTGSSRRLYTIALIAAMVESAFAAASVPGAHSALQAFAILGVALVLGFICVPLVGLALRLLALLGHIGEWPALPVPFWWLLAATPLIVGMAIVLPPLLALLPIACLVLIWRGRRQPGRWSAAGLFITVLPVAAFLALGGVALDLPLLQLVCGPLLVGALVWVGLRRKVTTSQPLVALLLWFAIATLGIVLLFDALRGTQALSDRFTAVQAVLLIAAQAWDVFTTAPRVATRPRRTLPLPARLLFFLAYTTLATLLVIYFAAWSQFDVVQGFGSFNDPDTWAEIGLVLFGAPLLTAVFVWHYGRWRMYAKRPSPTSAANEGAPVVG